MIEQARRLEQRGLELLWIGQLYEYEALALAALLGRETQRIALAHLREASAAAGRPFPRIAVGLPIAVCRDREAARATAARMLAESSALPSYRAVLARGGAAAPEDVAILGDEAEVRGQLARLAALGVSDFNAVCMPVPGEPDSLERTLALLAEQGQS